MGVVIRSLVWPRNIPYTCSDAWAISMIDHFNKKTGQRIFVPRTNEPDYVEITTSAGHATCTVGRKGGKQTLHYEANTKRSILHELGHCAGLGHENFHPDWPLKDALLAKPADNLHRMAFVASSKKYSSVGAYDPNSLMLYSPRAFFKQGDTDTKGRPISLSDPITEDLSFQEAQLLSMLYGGADVM